MLNRSILFNILILIIIILIPISSAVTIKGEIGNPNAPTGGAFGNPKDVVIRCFGLKLMDIEGVPKDRYQAGKWIVVKYDADYIQFDLRRGICVELQGEWYRAGDFYLTGPCKQISCSFKIGPKCTAGPIGSPQCSGQSLKQLYQDANCNQKWQVIDDCSRHRPSECCKNGACESCEEQRPKCSAGPIGPPQCSGGSARQLYQDANCDQKWQIIDDCSRYTPSKCCKNGRCENCEEQTPPSQPNQLPIISDLFADKKSPQAPETQIRWSAIALDPDNDHIYYKFMVSGPGTINEWKDMTGWIDSNTWTWIPTASDTGENSIGAFIRDGKHATEGDYDNYAGKYFDVEPANRPPVVSDISSDQKSPQPQDKGINWTAIAADPDNDQLYYKFMVSGPGTGNQWTDMTGWVSSNVWTWTASLSDVGENSVGVFVRDGKHAAEDDYDDYKGEYFVIEPANEPPVVSNLSSSKESPQQEGTAINWTAIASDQNNDTIYYKFMVSGPGTNSTWKDMSGWITSNVWTWVPTISDIGENSIGVFVRDGKHATEDDYDDYKGEYFSIEKSDQEAECDSPVEFQGEVISEHDYFGRIPTLEIRIDKFLSEPKLDTSIIEVERSDLTDQTIEMGDCVEVIGCPIKGTEDAKYAGGWLVSGASKPFSVNEISCEDKACGKILDYDISNGHNYPRGQLILSNMKYKSNLDSAVGFKGILLVKSPTGQVYSNYKNQRTPPNQEDGFGNNKGNAIDLKIPEDASLGSYSAKLELRRSDTDELCDSTDWIENQFTIGYRCVVQGGVIEKTKKDDELWFKLNITKIDCSGSFGHKIGDIISVYYNKYESIGECVEVEGGFDPGNYDGSEIDFFATKTPKTITCPSEYSKPQCAPGPVGNAQCFDNIAKQLYQSENCEQEWQIVEDCTNYDPSKCCNNGRCENCGEGPKPSEGCRDITFRGIVNDVGDITWDCKDWTGGGIAKLWEITVANVEGTPLSSRVIKVYSEDFHCNSADTRVIKGSVDGKIAKGDHVEVFGCYNETESSVTLSGKREYYIKIISGCKGIISGHVYDYETKQPIPSHAFLCVNLSEKDACGACLETDDSGYYEFSKCPKGLFCQNMDYSVYCWADNYETQVKTEKTDDEGNKAIDIYLKKKEPDVILFTGLFDSISTEEGLSWSVILDEKLSGPDPCSQELEVIGPSKSISDPAYSQVDKSIRKGDYVEVLGEYVYYPQTKRCAVILFSADSYYIKKSQDTICRDWWLNADTITSFAERQKAYYGATGFDYYEKDNFIMIVLYTGEMYNTELSSETGKNLDVPKVKLILFDKSSKKFKNDGSLLGIYSEYYCRTHKEDMSKILNSRIESAGLFIDDINKFAQDPWIQQGSIIAYSLATGVEVFGGCLIGAGVAPLTGGASVLACLNGAFLAIVKHSVADLVTSTGIKIKYEEMIEQIKKRNDPIQKLIDAQSKIELAEDIESFPDYLEQTPVLLKLYKNYQDARTLQNCKAWTKSLSQALLDEGKRQKSFTLTQGVNLLALTVSAGDIKTTTTFASLSGYHAAMSEKMISQARNSTKRFTEAPSFRNFEEAILCLLPAYDNLAIGYFLIATSLESCREAGRLCLPLSDLCLPGTGDLAAWGHDFFINSGLDNGEKVDNQIENYRQRARGSLDARDALVKVGQLQSYVWESIEEIVIPAECS